MTFTFYWRINAFTECVEVDWKFFGRFLKEYYSTHACWITDDYIQRALVE